MGIMLLVAIIGGLAMDAQRFQIVLAIASTVFTIYVIVSYRRRRFSMTKS